MKLQAQIGDELYNVSIERDGDNVSAIIDGREYKLETSQPEPNVFLLKHRGKVNEFFVSAPSEPSQPYVASSRHGSIEIGLIDPKRLRGSANADSHADGLAEIRTMMPGKVVRLVLEPGDHVEKNDSIMVVEAMKMQNDVRSPKDGVVKEVRVAEGSTVAAGDVLAVIE